MYTVYDFINNNIEGKRMKFGWKVEIFQHSSLSCSPEIALTYTMLNFDWHSLDFLNGELFNMFLSSESYKTMKEKKERGNFKHKRTYFSAYSIDELKNLTKEYKLKVNVDRLIDKAVKRRSEELKRRIEEQEKRNEDHEY